MNLESLEKHLHAIKSRPGRTALLLLGLAVVVIVGWLGSGYFGEKGKQLATQTPGTPATPPVPTEGPLPGESPTPARVTALTQTGNASGDAPVRADEKPPTEDAPLPLQQSIYLPMSKGNKWVYRKRVPEGVKVLCWEAWEIEGKLHYAHVPLDRIKPGTTEEVFTVGDELDEDGRKRWIIEVSNPEDARDGRYGGIIRKPEIIMWGRLISGAQVLEFGEMLTAENPFEGQLRQQRTLFPQSLLPNAEVLTHSMGVSAVTYECSPTPKTISVPAGKFSDCLEAITTVSAKDGQKRWTTYSYYAPRVGLVKEFQRNPDDRTTYSLELIDYKIQGPQ